MATLAAAPPPTPLTLSSIPTIDLRFLSQSDLISLSHSSSSLSRLDDVRSLDDIVIDRSVFNESAGSRKQTFSRLRLAAPKNTTTTATDRDSSLKHPLPPPPPHPPRPDSAAAFSDAERAENHRIVSLFKQLFNSESGEVELNELVEIPVNEPGSSSPNYAVPVSVGPRKRGRRPKGETLGSLDNEKTTDIRNENGTSAVVVYEDLEEKERELVNGNGEVVDLVELGKKEDPYAEEIRRRTEGLKGDEELLVFMSRLEGQWGSRRRRRRIVDAAEFGDALPNGWKVIVAIKKKQGNEWLFCRRYISPKGLHFATCKEIASYLMSLHGMQDNSALDEQHNTAPPEQHTATPPVVKKSASKNAEHIPLKAKTPLSSFTSPSSNQEKPLLPSENVYTGDPPGANVFKCHKCSTPYIQKEGLLHHLISCHKRKRRKAGEPVVDDVLVNGGKYECQFCEKTFTERHCYFAHVGIHVKIYQKSIEGSSGTGIKLNSNGPITTTSSMLGSVVDADSGSRTPHVAARNAFKPEEDNFNSRLNSVALDTEQKSQVSGKQESVRGQALNEHDVLHKTHNESVHMADGDLTPGSSMEEDSMSDDEDDDINEFSRKLAADEFANREICGNKDGQVGNVENCNDHVAIGMDVDHADEIASEGSLSDGDSDTSLPMDNSREDQGAFPGDAAEPRSEAGIDNAGTNTAVEENIVEGGSNHDLFGGDDDLPTCEIETYVENACIDSMKEPTMEIFNSQKDESTGDAGCRGTEGRIAGSNVFLSSRGVFGDSINEPSRVSSGGQPEIRTGQVGKVDSFLPSFFDVNQSTTENAPSITPRKKEETKSDRGSARGVLFPSGSNSRDGHSGFAAHDQQENIFASLGRQSLADDSNVFATCDNILKDSQREGILSSLSVGDHVQNINDRMRNAGTNVNAIPAGTGTARLPELGKMDSSMNNEVMLDFVGNMNEINRSVLSSAQHGMISESSSPFSLWNEQSYSVEPSHNGAYAGTRQEARQERARQNNSLSLAGFQQTYDLGYNLNKSYIGTVDELSRLDTYDHSRDTDLMIGFSNNEARSNQHVTTEDLWRSSDERVMSSGLGDSSSSHAHGSSSFRAFDILMDKGENELFGVNEKFDSLTGFDGLRSAAVEPMEFSFLSGPNSSTQLEEPKVMSYNAPEMDQGFDSSLWFSKGTQVSNMMGGHGRTTMCVWCGNTFHLDAAAAAETQAGSIGHLCQTCKDRISGQYM